MSLPVRVSIEPARGGVARAAGFDQALVACVLALNVMHLARVYDFETLSRPALRSRWWT